MPRIKLLPDEVASQVAAGEVVERPASVVKELVENALDAGADRVEVMIRGGGASLIRVVDNGCGMDRDDALLCLERHATSKIRTGADLATISTLGGGAQYCECFEVSFGDSRTWRGGGNRGFSERWAD
jgi:DNA mismatch repair protein MutL